MDFLKTNKDVIYGCNLGSGIFVVEAYKLVELNKSSFYICIEDIRWDNTPI